MEIAYKPDDLIYLLDGGILLIMKKVLALSLIICVVCIAGAAFAQPRHHEFAPGKDMPFMNHCPCRHEGFGFEGHHRHEGRHMRFAPNMPQEIRALVVELEKLKIDLDEALTSRPVNKAKALEVHAKMQTVKNALDNWRFERKLERLDKKANSKPIPKPKIETEAQAPESEPEE